MSDTLQIPAEKLNRYRDSTFRFRPDLRISQKNEAVHFVNDRGFIFFWPIRNIPFPSLWGAVAGNRPVPNNHDDPGHVTWRWKDELLGKNRWYYAKVLRGKSTIISFDVLPFFYALSPNFGSPEEDILISYQDGKLSAEEKTIFDVLSREGPLDSVTLRKLSGFSSDQNAYRFNRALTLLQRDFRICPIGTAEAGAWNYAFIYDVFHRQYPQVLDQTREITEMRALQEILILSFISIGSADLTLIKKLFPYSSSTIKKALFSLVEDSFLIFPTNIVGETGEWYTIHHLIDPK